MPLRVDPQADFEIITEADVNNYGSRNWFRVVILKALCPVSGVASIGFYIPQLAAEGYGFATPEQAMSSAAKLIIGLILILAMLL
jgi:hypothetical protein